MPPTQSPRAPARGGPGSERQIERMGRTAMQARRPAISRQNCRRYGFSARLYSSRNHSVSTRVVFPK